MIEQMKETGIIPVVVIENAKNAVPTAEALLAGGIDFCEITLRTEAAFDAISEVSVHCPKMNVGAGTVLNLEQCRQALDGGAKFIVSPGYSREIVHYCQEDEIPVIPGCVTPTEIMNALKMGVHVIKFFPANIYGGIPAMKALTAPFAGVKFIPTGGVNGENLGDYLEQPFIHAVGGSWLCTKSDIAAGNYDRITKLCKEAITVRKAINTKI